MRGARCVMAYLANSLNLGPGVLDLAGFNVWRGGGNGFVAELAVAPDILGTRAPSGLARSSTWCLERGHLRCRSRALPTALGLSV